jgi:hypothetical protein
VLIAVPTAALAGEPTGTTAADAPQMIPVPNQGNEPRDAGDRGGAGQLAVLAGVAVGVGSIVALVVRESRRARRR